MHAGRPFYAAIRFVYSDYKCSAQSKVTVTSLTTIRSTRLSKATMRILGRTSLDVMIGPLLAKIRNGVKLFQRN